MSRQGWTGRWLMDHAEENRLRSRIAEAESLQRELAPLVELCPLKRKVRTVAAVDADYDETTVYAAAVLFQYAPCAHPFEKQVEVRHVPFPYLPGFLSLREAPAILAALRKLSHFPDVVLVDGQGIAHPRRFGLACHVGILSRLPTIGVAKNQLVGKFEEPPPQRGAWSPLELEGQLVGAVLRTRTGVKPLFVSPGHLITLHEAVEIVLHCSTRYRIPEPLRMADQAARAARRACCRGGIAGEI